MYFKSMNIALEQVLIFTLIAVFLVPLFNKFKIDAILAYLFGGVLIGPSVLKLIDDPKAIMTFGELGIKFLLFIIGLELAPAKLWKLRKYIFGLGVAQVLFSGLVFFLICVYILNFNFLESYIISFGLAISSTALVVQILNQKNQFSTDFGQGSFSILMLQDMFVVPFLASISFLTIKGQISTFELGLKASIAIVVITGLFFTLPRVIDYGFRMVASTKMQEIFIATSLSIVIAVGLLFEKMGLSMGLGAFFAGVILAESRYRHEIETSLVPIKSLLLGLFFISVGMSIELSVVYKNIFVICGVAIGLMIAKFIITRSLTYLFKFQRSAALKIAVLTSQGGEFAFIAFGAALFAGIFSEKMNSVLVASVALTMVLTPFAFKLLESKLSKKQDKNTKSDYDSIDLDEESEVVIAGYGRFGQIVARILKSEDISYTILEHNASQVETARKFGSKVYYGDASRIDILHAAKLNKSKYFVLAVDNPEQSLKIAEIVIKNFSNLKIFARARNRQHAIKLKNMGIEIVHRELLLTSLQLTKDILLEKKNSVDRINNVLRTFKTHDEEILEKQAKIIEDDKFTRFTMQANKDLELLLREDREKFQSSKG